MIRRNRVQEISEMSLTKIMQLDRQELAKAVSTLASAGNKRLKRLDKENMSTPASVYIKKHGGKFSVAGKNVAELREEFQRVKVFLSSETSTVRGYKKWQSKVADTLKQNAGIDYDSLTELQKRKFWKAYSKLEELDSANVYGANYRSSVNSIYDAVKSGMRIKDIDAFVNELDEKLYSQSVSDFMSDLENPFTTI